MKGENDSDTQEQLLSLLHLWCPKAETEEHDGSEGKGIAVHACAEFELISHGGRKELTLKSYGFYMDTMRVSIPH